MLMMTGRLACQQQALEQIGALRFAVTGLVIYDKQTAVRYYLFSFVIFYMKSESAQSMLWLHKVVA